MILCTALPLLLLALALSYIAWRKMFAPSVQIGSNDYIHFFIPTGSSFNQVSQSLNELKLLRYPRVFERLARLKEYPDRVRPGRYRIHHGMSNNELVNLLRSGRQDPVNVIFNNIRTPAQLAGRISQQIEADSIALLALMTDEAYLARYGISPVAIAMLFIPNTYEFFWNTNAEKFMARMHRETDRFWNSQRLEVLERIGMTRSQAVTLASIVELETQQNSEKPRIAGVYQNRLKKGMLLQADPTLVFAHGDFAIRRVLNRHKAIVSPYNTYKYAGLPPGPICFPSGASIDAVLNYELHDYLFFCARDDFSGFHAFARTYHEHLQNARRYQKALNLMNIKN
ncbi:MAG: endolytic transglycosylase MltG [Bacteroidales bacterium]|nr:endolytic transglycosylase MltG [Bacteroidales bacterium]